MTAGRSGVCAGLPFHGVILPHTGKKGYVRMMRPEGGMAEGLLPAAPLLLPCRQYDVSQLVTAV